MILMDLSQIFFSNLHVALSKPDFKDQSDKEFENIIRHMILNSIRSYRSKLLEEWGEIVVCVDSKDNWRDREFSHYKERRKIKRESSSTDWDKIFGMFNIIKGELETIFPYRFIEVPGAEADDIIGTIVHEFNTKIDKIFILSGDSDFKNLLKYPNVKLYSPVKKEFLEEKEPEYALFEKIVTGDSGDGIPNILSDDDVFVTDGKRQKPIRKTKVRKWFENGIPEEHREKFNRNRTLIDLSLTPEILKNDIIYNCRKQHNKNRDNILDYLKENELNNLIDKIKDF